MKKTPIYREGSEREQLERYRNLAKISSDWFWETDETFTVTYMSDSVERITGLSRDNYIGVSRFDLASEETKQTEGWRHHVEQVANRQPIKNFEYKHVGTDGHTVYLRVNAIPLFNEDGGFRGYLGSTTDISELVRAKQEAEHMARTDALTGLNNRRAFFEQAKTLDDLAARYCQTYSVIMMDIDHFKRINDTYGHDAGDQVIRSVAGAIGEYKRTSDIAGRLGGEEFAIILPQTGSGPAESLAERLRLAIQDKTVRFDNDNLAITASFGVAQYQDERNSIEQVISLADRALYQAKGQGRNQVVSLSG